MLFATWLVYGALILPCYNIPIRHWQLRLPEARCTPHCSDDPVFRHVHVVTEDPTKPSGEPGSRLEPGAEDRRDPRR